MRIRGPAAAPYAAVLGRLGQFSPHPRFAAEMAPALWAAAVRYGIDPVVMVAQAGHETGWGRYSGLVPPEFHNPCGLKLRDLSGFPNSEVTAAHAVFPDWTTGARAHAQHLMAYCQVGVSDPIVDPRWVWVYGRKPAIIDVEQLGGSWAPNPAYGQLVATTASKLGAPAMDHVHVGNDYYTSGRPGGIRLVVLHTTESPSSAGMAVGVANYLAGHNASAHYVVDAATCVHQVDESDTAWAAPGANGDGIQIEQCAYAGWGAEWGGADAQAMLANTSWLVADICARHGIPHRQLTNSELAAGAAGVVGHVQVSEVYQRSDHWDPGPSYPWNQVMTGEVVPPTPPPEEDEEDDMLRYIVQKGTPPGSMHGEGTNWVIDGLDAYPISDPYTIQVMQAHGVLMTAEQMSKKGWTWETDGLSIQRAYRVQQVPEGVPDTTGPPRVILDETQWGSLAGWTQDTRNIVNANTDKRSSEVIANSNRLAADLAKAGGGPVDVAGVIAKATKADLAKAGVNRLREALLEAVMAQPVAAASVDAPTAVPPPPAPPPPPA